MRKIVLLLALAAALVFAAAALATENTVALGTGIRAKGPGARGAPVGRATHSPSRLPDPRRQ